ncbi:hypothetical protein [Streptomyces sp. NPDC058683]|uniref:wHTH domain-containing protein n=1 Tax=Streptomyces sp. NPDC058683 TaxID=3346597 RepID=UPI003659B974
MTYEEQLERLLKAAGGPSSVSVSAHIARKCSLTVPPPTIDGWRQCKVVPRDKAKLHAFLHVLTELAQVRNPDSVPRLTRSQWDNLADAARRAREGKAVKPEEPPVRPGFGQDWLDAVTTSRAWQLVLAAEQERAVTVRERTRDVVRRLAKLYDERRGLLDQDPWHDPEFAHRMTQAAELLLHEMHGRLQRASLAPAEAALIALLPFLYQVHGAYTVAELAHVDPANLNDRVQGGPYREKHNVLLRSHRRLVRQAERGHTLPDRGDGRPEIGWWLFHQWARQETGSLRVLLAELDLGDTGLGMLLDRRLLTRLLACAHLPPRTLYARGRDGLLNHEPFPVELEGGEWQKVREDLVGPLFAIAHAMALEATDLPPDVVEHVGIPEPVTAASLRIVLNEARWIPRGDALGLQAACGHPAVVAALVEHTRHVDTLLRDARRTRPTDEIGELPVYAHADEVHEVDDTGEPKRGGEVIRFRLDETRIQELLMGENLYRDRSLAIRELYQNALDACRLRKAWEHARNGEDDFRCRIEFEQGYDEDEQRYYLECRDNGIGMDETVLAEVFSQAGVRFAEHARFQEESEAWRRDGIDVYPNSRFGIGVLSYFMLADEIRVTTCPARGGSEQLTVLITGPGHYFRVRLSEERRRVGTTVRLYLRDGKKAPSCVQELRRFLGIAEFHTRARHDKQEARWKPGVLRRREAPFGGPAGFLAHGRTVGRPEGGYGVHGQVVWCEHGGGILADGIFIQPRVRRGVLAGPNVTLRLRGAVVNLTGATRPKDLSVDRMEILDGEVGDQVERLVRDALPALFAAQPPLLTTRWLAEVSGANPRLADIVTEAAGAAGFALELHGHTAPVARVGFFPPDLRMVHRKDARPGRDGTGTVPLDGTLDDVTLLWRLLAHRPSAELAALTELVPELSRVRGVLAARPSDVLLRTLANLPWNRKWPEKGDLSEELSRPGHAYSVAEACGVAYRDVLGRMELLGLTPPQAPGDDIEVDPLGTALLDSGLGGPSAAGAIRWCDPGKPVPPGHLLRAHLALNIGIEEARARMAALGFETPGEGMPTDTPDAWVVAVLSHSLNAQEPWLSLDTPVDIGHVVAAMSVTRRSFPDVVETLRSYGFRPELGGFDEPLAGELLRRSEEWDWDFEELRRLKATTPLPLGLLARAAQASSVPLGDMARRMEGLSLTVGMLPDEVEPEDIRILGSRWVGFYQGGDEIPLESLVSAAHELGMPPARLAARLRVYGLNPPDTQLPEQVGPHDRVYLREVRAALGSWDRLGPDRRVPVSAVVRAAHNTAQPPNGVVDRLACYGLGTSLTAPPTKARRDDPGLLGVAVNGEGEQRLDQNEPVPLHHLVSAGRNLLMEPEEVVERVTAFGFRVPVLGVDDLDEVDRGLCFDTYVQGTTVGVLPLSLWKPISDFLEIVAYAGLPLPDLLTRLTRLDVKLSRVAEAVRAALPRVPGLVMTPKEP